MNLAKALTQHLSGDLRIPVIEGREQGKKYSADNDIVEVRHHKVRVAELPVEGGARQHDPGQAGDQELEQESDAEQHRRLEAKSSTPHRAQPVKNLYAR